MGLSLLSRVVKTLDCGAMDYPVHVYVTRHAKMDLMGIVKSIHPGQPAQSAQADQGRKLSLFADFLCINPFPNNRF